MIKYSGLGRFEFFVVSVVISIIVLVAMGRYMTLAQEARTLSFELMSHHFMTAAVNAKTQWLLTVVNQGKVQANNFSITTEVGSLYFTEKGWPLSENPERAGAVEPNLADCYRLWVFLLQPPEAISIQGEASYASQKYHVSLVPNGCRYFLATDENKQFYFDYLPKDGRVLLSESARRDIK